MEKGASSLNRKMGSGRLVQKRNCNCSYPTSQVGTPKSRKPNLVTWRRDRSRRLGTKLLCELPLLTATLTGSAFRLKSHLAACKCQVLFSEPNLGWLGVSGGSVLRLRLALTLRNALCSLRLKLRPESGCTSGLYKQTSSKCRLSGRTGLTCDRRGWEWVRLGGAWRRLAEWLRRSPPRLAVASCYGMCLELGRRPEAGKTWRGESELGASGGRGAGRVAGSCDSPGPVSS